MAFPIKRWIGLSFNPFNNHPNKQPSMTRPTMPFAVSVLALPRMAKRAVALIVDLSLCVLTVWFAFYLRLDEFISFTAEGPWRFGINLSAAAAVLIAFPIFVASGLYRAIFRYSGLPALAAVLRAVGIYGLIYAVIFMAIGIDGVPRTVGVLQPLLLLLSIGTARFLVRAWLGDEYQSILRRKGRPKALIYGAGSSGRQLAAAMSNNPQVQVIGFLDDDDRLHGQVLNGLPIFDPKDLEQLVITRQINDVLLAMPSLSRSRRNEVLAQIRAAQVSVRTLPSVTDLVQGKVSVADLRELDIDDLLGREPVLPNHLLLGKNVANKVVMVTGAGGSIGGELCRQILAAGPSKLLLIEQSEFALYAIHQSLEEKSVANLSTLSPTSENKPVTTTATELMPLLASVQDSERIREIISIWRPDTIYHAAAYKHVPLVEHNPAEGIKNNVFGTLRTALAAAEHGVADFVLISTDKAVRPTNIMGASKRLAEMVLQALAANDSAISTSSKGKKTTFSMVRFGNVLGSSGSVVPKFRQQIKDGGPITLTHPDVTRYFMTIPEAAQLVIQAGAMARGGDVFVLDMGEPVKIMDLARRMVELSGLSVRDEARPDGDIEIAINGLRPGEKLYEELLIGDNPASTSHPRIMKAQDDFITWDQLQKELQTLETALAANDVTRVRSLMEQKGAGYAPAAGIVDWIHLEQETAISASR